MLSSKRLCVRMLLEYLEKRVVIGKDRTYDGQIRRVVRFSAGLVAEPQRSMGSLVLVGCTFPG